METDEMAEGVELAAPPILSVVDLIWGAIAEL